jgi:hypothetical protein
MPLSPPPLNAPNLLRDARVYLSGPMDFVADREGEKKFGWRNRVGQVLTALGVTVFDPWFKPEIRGVQGYGREDAGTSVARAGWTFEDTNDGAARRAQCADVFWPALHIDLRMVDTSDFVIAYCPTSTYSVGTPHEIILARQQRKPVLLVSPPVTFPALTELRRHLELQGDSVGTSLLDEFERQATLKPNADGSPSQWYMPLVGGEHFFDGFGFYLYREQFGWQLTVLDVAEEVRGVKKPLLPFLAQLNEHIPQKWDRHKNDYGPNDDWLLWALTKKDEMAAVGGVHSARS